MSKRVWNLDCLHLPNSIVKQHSQVTHVSSTSTSVVNTKRRTRMKFFRIITTDITPRSKLKLPENFVARHGANISATVTLNVPTGAKWRVELKKKEDGFWFGNGLFEFAESLGLKYGHFLMFDYVDVDVFHVVVIDMSAVEVHYPAPLTTVDHGQHLHQGDCPYKRPKPEQVEDDPDMDGAPALLRKYTKKIAKASEKRRIGSVVARDETDHTTIPKCSTFGREIILNNIGKIQCVIQGRRRSETESEKVIAMAKAYKAEEPVCIIVMRPTYVCEKPSIGAPLKCQLLFPQCFIKEYFDLSNKCVTLGIDSGRSWPVEYRLVMNKQSFFTYGWKQFVVDNCLRSGDVCLFELIRGAENGLKVVIFRSVEEHHALS